MDKSKAALKWLEDNGVTYQLITHPAVYTIEELDTLCLDDKGCICKNLFLRDAKGKRHFLISVCGHKTVDLKTLGEKLGGVRLSFASEQRLAQYLNLSKGAVTPLGVLFDTDAAVEVVLDADLEQQGTVGVHPCENTATVFVAFHDLERLLRANGNRVTVAPL